MKSNFKMLFVAAAFVLPALAHADPQSQVSRAQVHEQLLQLQKAGYNPLVDNDYPNELQAAEATVARDEAARSYGGTDMASHSASGK